jgi:hypothetical protein
MQILKEGFTLKIGDGESSFWYDSWVLKERMCSVVPVVAIQDTTMKINDVWLNGGWNFQEHVNWQWIWQIQGGSAS